MRLALVYIGEGLAGIDPQLGLCLHADIGTDGPAKVGLPNQIVLVAEPGTARFAFKTESKSTLKPSTAFSGSRYEWPKQCDKHGKLLDASALKVEQDRAGI